MFNKIRYAAKVLSSSTVAPWDTPDIMFEEHKPPEVSAFSRRIASFLEIFLYSLIIGIFSVPLLAHIFPAQKTANLTGITAGISAFVALLLNQLLERMKFKLATQLDIREKIAPYLGRRITRAVRIIRG